MAVININGIIGQDYTYKQFITDYANSGEEQIRLMINSVGGCTYEGGLIAKFIQSHSDRFLSVINTGDVASIAASIFLALPFEKRFFDFRRGVALIHNPYIQNVDGYDTTAAGLKQMAEWVEADEKEIRAFIVKQTGANPDVVKALMDINEELNEEQLISINFANIIKQEFKAVAILNSKKENKMDKEFIEKTTSVLDKILAFFNKGEVVAIMLTDAEGNQIEFPDLQEGIEPKVGDKVNAPDGDVIMASGQTFVIAGGVISEIKEIEAPTEETATEDLEAIKAELAAAKAELEALKGAQAQVAEFKAEVVALKSQIKSQMLGSEKVEKPNEVIETPKFKYNGRKK